MSGYLSLPGSNGEYASVPNIGAYAVTDLDVRLWCSIADLTQIASQTLLGKLGSLSTRNWRIDASNSNIVFSHSDTGAADVDNLTVSIATLGISSAAQFFLRYTLDVSAGVKTAYTKPVTDMAGLVSNSGWTSKGSATGAATSIFNDSSLIEAGATLNGTLQQTEGDYYGVVLMDAVGGSVVLGEDFTDLTAAEVAAAAFTEDSGNAATVTLNGTGWSYVRSGKRRNLAGPGQLLQTGG